MSVANVRLHLRVPRRLSLAVLDQANPSYEHSALFYFDKNEEFFGRKGSQTVLQESVKYFDAFQSAVPDLTDLRNVSETLHVMFLRGYPVKPFGRTAGETAKAITVMTKVPGALLPRFPLFQSLLESFGSLKAFHLAYPTGMDMQGNEIKNVKVQYPIYGESSIDKLTSEVLLPLMLFKKHQSLVGHSTPLAIGWIQDMLPELERARCRGASPEGSDCKRHW